MTPLAGVRDRLALVAAVVGPLVVCLVLVPFRGSVANTNAALVLVVVVVAVAANGHRVAGVVAAASAAVWFDLLLVPPYGRLTITSRADLETTVLLLVVGAAVSELAARGRRSRVIALTDEAYLDGIQRSGELVAAGAEPLDVVRYVTTELTGLLGLSSCRFEYGTFLGNPPRLDPDGQVRAGGWVFDVDALGFPDDEVELLVRGGRVVHGRFMFHVAPGTVPNRGARRVAVILADQVGAAMAQPARR
jgi:hypothetical protein